jgi:hypothetical protein
MTQLLAWPLPLAPGANGEVLLDALNNTIAAILTENSGPSEPPYLFAGMKFADETNFLSKRRNLANTDSVTEHAIGVRIDRNPPIVQLGNLTGSLNRYLFCPPVAWYAVDLVVCSKTATVSTGVNNWAFQVRKLVAAQNLFAVAETTDGDELAVDTPKVWPFTANQSIAQNELLELQITENGSATSLADCAVLIRGYPRGS